MMRRRFANRRAAADESRRAEFGAHFASALREAHIARDESHRVLANRSDFESPQLCRPHHRHPRPADQTRTYRRDEGTAEQWSVGSTARRLESARLSAERVSDAPLPAPRGKV